MGCDFVGTVEETGSQVEKLQKGDTIAGLIWGGGFAPSDALTTYSFDPSAGEIKGLGGYSEYTVADDKISFKVPGNITPEEAATLPLASMTAWLALFSQDCLNIPRDSGSETSVLIWGGSCKSRPNSSLRNHS